MLIKLLREYGVGTNIDFSLFDPTGAEFITSAVHVDGDTKISIDGAAEIDTSNGFTRVDQGYRMAIEATEVTGKSMRFPIVDQDVTKIWRDGCIIIETYGHVNAMHPFITLNTLVDGVSIQTINKMLIAMVDGRFKKDTPDSGDITFYEQDNSTVVFIVHIDEDNGERTRIFP